MDELFQMQIFISNHVQNNQRLSRIDSTSSVTEDEEEETQLFNVV